MSDRFDRSALDLLDRADELSPAMSVEPGVVIADGRRKVRRRRTSAAGGVGVLALVGALWLGGPFGPFAPTDHTGAPVPASISWQDGVDVELFDNEAAASTQDARWTGRLRSSERSAAPELVLTRDGESLASLTAQDGPGDVLVYAHDRMVVAVWEPPTGSLGEEPLWAPGVSFGQGGAVRVDGTELRFATATFVAGADPELEELYWFTETAGRAATGAQLDSTVLTTGESTAVAMLDERRGVWGMARPGDGARVVFVDRLMRGSGVNGWVPAQGGVATGVGVLPRGASEPTVDAPSTTLVKAELGSTTAVMASDPTMTSTAPTVRFSLDGEEHAMEQFVRPVEHSVLVGAAPVTVRSTPEALELRVADTWAVIPDDELDGAGAFFAPVGDAVLVGVPGWDVSAKNAEDLRVLVGSDEEQDWIVADSSLVSTLIGGRPLVILGLNEGMLGEGETVRGVGLADGDEVVPHELTEGVSTLDLGL